LAELEVKSQRELNAGNAGALKNLAGCRNRIKNLKNAKINPGTANYN
jgi:hypothetical protein